MRAAGTGLDNLSHCSEQYKDDTKEDNNKTKKGELEFEAWMRVLDSMVSGNVQKFVSTFLKRFLKVGMFWHDQVFLFVRDTRLVMFTRTRVR